MLRKAPGIRSGCRAIAIGMAFSIAILAAVGSDAKWELGPFTRPEAAVPIITPAPQSVFTDVYRQAPVHWEALHTFNPAAIVRNGAVYLLYRAEDNTGEMRIGGHTSRLGLAISQDGLHFTREAAPVFFPAQDEQASREWPGGVEDPRLVESEDGTYVLAYTQYNGKTYDIGIATSKDLTHWTKHGPAFGDGLGGMPYKSGGIVTTLKGGRLIAARLQGKYWMYWGEGGIHLATSEDLIHWSPMVDSHHDLVVVLRSRPRHFDSDFPEVGPPPILTDRGIILIYNGKNAGKDGDRHLSAGTYAVGQALFSAQAPEKVIARTEKPSLQPELPFERTGQYQAGTTFAEGLVLFKDKWMLYYGCADSLVAVAAAPHGR